jgi:hypothetical protein
VRRHRLTVNDRELKVANLDRSGAVAQRASSPEGLPPEPLAAKAPFGNIAKTVDKFRPSTAHNTHGTPCRAAPAGGPTQNAQASAL